VTDRRAVSPLTRCLLDLIDEAYDHRSWHGTNLRGAIRGLTLELAAWRPARGRHNIWETVVHAAYWKYAVRRLLTGEARGSFPLKGSNWWTRPEEHTNTAWRRDVALLAGEHQRLRDAVASFPPTRWARRRPGTAFSNAALVRGAAAHDLYHAGQIQLLKRLARS
jgi:uncharacterized damage-inducible protein DinB